VRDFIRSMSTRTKNTVFGTVFGACLLATTFPPFFFAASGKGISLFGVPIAVAYWLIIFAVIMTAIWALYVVEDIRGEIIEDDPGSASAEEVLAVAAAVERSSSSTVIAEK
jgi:hypothetical protein